MAQTPNLPHKEDLPQRPTAPPTTILWDKLLKLMGFMRDTHQNHCKGKDKAFWEFPDYVYDCPFR